MGSSQTAGGHHLCAAAAALEITSAERKSDNRRQLHGGAVGPAVLHTSNRTSHSILTTTCEVGTVIILAIQVKKLRHREAQTLMGLKFESGQLQHPCLLFYHLWWTESTTGTHGPSLLVFMSLWNPLLVNVDWTDDLL